MSELKKRVLDRDVPVVEPVGMQPSLELVSKQVNPVTGTMNPKIIKIKDEAHWLGLREKNINSTEVSCLFGVNPYMTHYQLWNIKAGKADSGFFESEAMSWGKALEPVIAKRVAKVHNLDITPMKDYIEDVKEKIGSSFDYFTDCGAILEIKNVSVGVFNKSWTDERAPDHIEFQVQHQMLLTGRDHAYIGALVGGNKLHLIRRERDDDLILEMRKRILCFWSMIDAGIMPDPDFENDSRFVIDLNKNVNKSKNLSVDNSSDVAEWARQYRSLSDSKKKAEAHMEEMKAKILNEIGDVGKVTGPGFSITSSEIGEKEISYVRRSYRSFRVNWKKVK